MGRAFFLYDPVLIYLQCVGTGFYMVGYDIACPIAEGTVIIEGLTHN